MVAALLQGSPKNCPAGGLHDGDFTGHAEQFEDKLLLGKQAGHGKMIILQRLTRKPGRGVDDPTKPVGSDYSDNIVRASGSCRA